MIIEENNNEILNKRNNKIISGLIHEGGQFRRSSSLENTAYGSGKDGWNLKKYAVDVRNPRLHIYNLLSMKVNRKRLVPFTKSVNLHNGCWTPIARKSKKFANYCIIIIKQLIAVENSILYIQQNNERPYNRTSRPCPLRRSRINGVQVWRKEPENQLIARGEVRAIGSRISVYNGFANHTSGNFTRRIL
jgi:hypothetical protein